jgi:Na+/pantothenate symporter
VELDNASENLISLGEKRLVTHNLLTLLILVSKLTSSTPLAQEHGAMMLNNVIIDQTRRGQTAKMAYQKLVFARTDICRSTYIASSVVTLTYVGIDFRTISLRLNLFSVAIFRRLSYCTQSSKANDVEQGCMDQSRKGKSSGR